MKIWILSALALALMSCQARKPFDGPLALTPEKPLSLRDCATRICPTVHDPVCITYDYGGHRYQQSFSNACEVCIAPEHIVSRQPGACGSGQ